MNKVFENIIEKLEEYMYKNLVEHDSEQSQHCQDIGDCGMRDCVLCVFDKAIGIVKQEAEQHNNGWIPCSERLPEERETVLLQDFDGFYELGVCTVKCGIKGFEDGDWWSSANNFIAWQPLPQPYQNGE